MNLTKLMILTDLVGCQASNNCGHVCGRDCQANWLTGCNSDILAAG